MSKYIDAEALLKRLAYDDSLGKFDEPAQVYEVAEIIRNMSAADVVLVKRGKWVPADSDKSFRTCSNCHCGKMAREIVKLGWKYCPYCGAKMDKEG